MNMIKKIIPVLILLFRSTTALTQDAVTAALQKDWQEYQSRTYQEKIFVHPDKTFFLAGETLWFSIYGLDASLHTPCLSVIAYAELLNKDHQPILQGKIHLQDGKGAGSFPLPSSIPTGNYQLRCYTSWMKNGDPGLFFHQQITIINTLRPNTPTTTATPFLSFRFFPEGGNLVYGQTSRLAFKTTGDHQHGLDCTGFILDQQHDTVTRFHSTHLGMGSFLFTPVKGKRYTAVITTPDTTFQQDLPAIYDDGYLMHLTEEQDGKIKIAVSCPHTPQDPSVYLLIHTRRRTAAIQTAHLANNKAVFSIDKTSLPAGISHLTIFDAAKAPVCQRLYYRQPSHMDTMTLDAQLSQTSFNTRKKAALSLTTTNPAGTPAKADLSLSVFLIDSLQDLPNEDIVSFLLLSSELKGRIENPRYYFQDTTGAAKEALDNLLLTQGWSRFKWEEVLQHKRTYLEFLPETNGPLIAGRMIDRTTGTNAPPAIGYLSVPGRYFTFGAAKSRQDGTILFNTKSFYGSNNLIVQTSSGTSDTNYRIDILNPFYEKPTDWESPPLSIAPSMEHLLLDRSIDMQVDNAYLQEKKSKWQTTPGKDTLPFYGHGDHGYRLDDYTRFHTLEEVMREYIDEVHVPAQSGKYHFRVRNNLFNVYFDNDPLMLIDGVPVYDAEKILEIDPLKFRQIDVVARKFYTGPLVSNGIVSYRTYDGNLGGYRLDPNAIIVHYEGLQLQQEFYTPAYDGNLAPSSRIPDLRNVLQWIPDIDTRQEGKSSISFYTSDIPGTYALFVQGITDQGLPGSRLITFTVQ